jgi:transposase
MQGKDPSEQEPRPKSNAGIDVSKLWLDAHVLPAGESLRVPNTRDGIRQLKRWLDRFDPALIVVEATGKWHRPLHRSLHASGLTVAVVDPFRVRMFAKAQGVLAKTDRLDAKVLAQFAAVMTPASRPPTPEIMEELAELVTARESAVAEETALKNQRAAANGAFLKRQLVQRMASLAKAITALEREILARIRADAALERRYTILTSIPGIGFVAAVTLIVGLAELGSCNTKQVSMLAGLAPIADESGERQGVRVVWGGRPRIRSALYLASLSAARFNADMAAFYRRLIDNGKAAKLAIIAVARKLVILANTLIAEDRIWTPIPPKHP